MSKLETAKRLAQGHFEVEPYLKKAFLLEPVNEDDPKDPIKLLEVVEGTIERGIEPIAFGAEPEYGIQYPSVIVEISPREYEALLTGKLDFGIRGWALGTELLAS